MNIKAVQSFLGHADISTTMYLYVDATKEMKDEASRVLNKYLME